MKANSRLTLPKKHSLLDLIDVFDRTNKISSIPDIDSIRGSMTHPINNSTGYVCSVNIDSE